MAAIVCSPSLVGHSKSTAPLHFRPGIRYLFLVRNLTTGSGGETLTPDQSHKCKGTSKLESESSQAAAPWTLASHLAV